MTKEEAIKGLKSLVKVRRKYGDMQTMKDEIECLDMAIIALEQEPCEDEYIKVPKKALKYRTAGMVAYNAEWLKNHFDMERAFICGEQEPKTGHWIFDEILDKHYYCSECKSMGVDYWDYCPYCGAKMAESEEV